MALNLERMLDRCRRGQWDVHDFDWDQEPIALCKFDEIEACKQFTNLIYIERIAALAFLELSRKSDDPLEREIFATFYDDELRHAEAMARLAQYFDRNQYQIYAPQVTLVAFVQSMSGMIKSINPEFASAMVTAGELLLDVAFLRSVNDYYDDPLSRAVIEKVNQDESRHIAMDFYLCEKYADADAPPLGVRDFIRTMSNPSLIGGMAWATVALTDLFGRVETIMDPTSRRFDESLRRFQLLGERNPVIAKNPNYAAVKRINAAVRHSMTDVNRVMKLLRVGIHREIAEAEARGEKKRYDGGAAGDAHHDRHDVLGAADALLAQA